MMLLLGSLLVGSSCLLGIRAEITVMPRFNYKKVAGQWFPLANINIKISYPQYTLQPQPNGKLKYIVRFPKNGKCNTKESLFTKQGQAGMYTTQSKALAQIVDTDYQTYMISHITRGRDTYLTLAGRQSNLTPDLETKFRTVATSLGITGEIIRNVQEETC